MIAIVAAAAAVSLASPAETQKQLAELQHIYAQSCEVRAYAAFDDLCDALKKQMREAERSHRAALRAAPKGAAAAPTSGPAPASTDPALAN